MVSKELEQKIDLFVEQNKEALLADIAKLIEIPSVSVDTEGEGSPFGMGCRKALDAALEICQRMGFSTKNHNYYAGTASIGQGEKEITVMGHLDVVPEGSGWSVDPYKMTVKDGYIYGRGVADDKGPIMLGVYAIKCLQELGVPLNYTFRAVFGCSEERGMGDVPVIQQQEKMPAFMFTPDAEFPLINGEKGIMGAQVSFPVDGKTIVDFYGGLVSNMVADRTTAVLKGVTKEQLGQLDPKVFDVEETAQGLQVTAKGKGSHASMPEGSVNAIALLSNMLAQSGLLSPMEQKACQDMAATLADYNGKGLGIDCEDEVSGKITHISGVAKMENNEIILNYNIRYPVTAKGEELTQRLVNHTKAMGCTGVVLNDSKPSYRSADTAEVQALLSAYNQATGENGQPMVIGGGTYARHFPNAVAFGPNFLDMPNPAGEGKGGVHMADECTEIDRMLKAVKIYTMALLNLNELSL